ncbi:MAG: GNAT family N-acetyltransferase [Cytophagia bacterium]|jgi:amino-acid N-acetyltransferase|nr:GNAT family N-acetyltransferase [Cytophagia bacterium]NBW34816.1 GNAT family N-acetyltransferase [Cytophagia bacterium]
MVSQIIKDQIALEKLQSFLQKNALPFRDVKLEGSVYLYYLDDHKQLVASGGLELFGSYALLRSVAVDQEQRGKKFGQQIVHDLLTKAKSLGVTELYLLTETAERFFENKGFTKISREQAPEAILNSSEFKTVCPVSAVCMVNKITLA